MKLLDKSCTMPFQIRQIQIRQLLSSRMFQITEIDIFKFNKYEKDNQISLSKKQNSNISTEYKSVFGKTSLL